MMLLSCVRSEGQRSDRCSGHPGYDAGSRARCGASRSYREDRRTGGWQHSKADNFQIRPGDPRYWQMQGTLTQDRLSGSDLVGGGDFRRDASLEPGEEFSQSIPEGLHRRQCREMVAEHVIPRAFKIGAVRLQIGRRAGDRYALEFAFLAQDIEQHRWRWSRVAGHARPAPSPFHRRLPHRRRR